MHNVLFYILHTRMHAHTTEKNPYAQKCKVKYFSEAIKPARTVCHTHSTTHNYTQLHTPLSHRWLSEGVRASWGLCLSILWVTSLEPNFIFLILLLFFISSSHSPSLLSWHSFITCRQEFCFTAIRMQVVHHSNLGRRSDSFSGSLSSPRWQRWP